MRTTRGLVAGCVLATALLTLGGAATAVAQSTKDKYAPPKESALPPSDMKLNLERVALVVTDPQIDFLSPDGVAWGLVGNSVKEMNTVKNLERLFAGAKKAGIVVAISPHYYLPTDYGWKFEGGLEKAMHAMKMFDRPSAYSLEGFDGSGADFMPQYKKRTSPSFVDTQKGVDNEPLEGSQRWATNAGSLVESSRSKPSAW